VLLLLPCVRVLLLPLLLLLLLCAQIAGGQRYRPPAVDVNAPDLFIPLMGLWSYALLSCVVLAFKQAFKPEMMSSTVRPHISLLSWIWHKYHRPPPFHTQPDPPHPVVQETPAHSYVWLLGVLPDIMSR
jgi:hypothetical protein